MRIKGILYPKPQSASWGGVHRLRCSYSQISNECAQPQVLVQRPMRAFANRNPLVIDSSTGEGELYWHSDDLCDTPVTPQNSPPVGSTA